MRKKIKQVVGILLSLVLAIGLMPGMSMTAKAEEGQGQNGSGIVKDVPYLADRTFDGKEIMETHDCIKVTSETREWGSSEEEPSEEELWYVVNEDVTISERVELKSWHINLILCDGVTLKIPKGIHHKYCGLNIYGQINSTGKLIIDQVEDGNDGIGWNADESPSMSGPGPKFYGGTISVTGGKGGAGIADGWASIDLFGGSLLSIGGEGAEAFGARAEGEYGHVNNSLGRHVRLYEGENNKGDLIAPEDIDFGKTMWEGTGANKLFAEYVPQTHSYRIANDGKTLILECEDRGSETSSFEITIKAPTLMKYGETGEGISEKATVNDNHFVFSNEDIHPIISYYNADSSGNKIGSVLTAAPTEPGTYWAEFSMGEGENKATAHVVYTIAKEVATSEVQCNLAEDSQISDIESEQIENQLATIADAELKKETETIGQDQTREVKVSMEAQEISKENASNDVKNEIDAIEQAAVKVIPAADQEKMEIAFLNINIKKGVIVKTVTNGQANGDDPVWHPMTSLPQVVDIPVKFNMTGKFNAKVARYHGGVAQVFTKLKTRPAKNALKDGAYWVEGSGENTIVHIYSSKFSTYALFTSGDKEYVTEDTNIKPSNSQTQEVTNKDESVTVYRLYYVPTKEHFYTTNAYERSVLISKYGWIDEGVAWKSPKEPKTDEEKKTIKPVYRLFNPITTDHHYTTDLNERNTLIKKYGWIDESIAFYSNTKGETSVYRLWHPALITGAHHFTTSKYEYDVLTTRGWVGETEAFKVNAEK